MTQYTYQFNLHHITYNTSKRLSLIQIIFQVKEKAIYPAFAIITNYRGYCNSLCIIVYSLVIYPHNEKWVLVKLIILE